MRLQVAFRRSLISTVLVASLAGNAPAYAQPGPLSHHDAVFDAARDRMIVIGGYDNAIPRGEVWSLSLGDSLVWERLAPAGSSMPARFGHGVVHDPVSDDAVVFGGAIGAQSLGDVWVLALTPPEAWREIQPAGPAPQARRYHGVAFDARRRRMLVFGGESGGLAMRDVWALSLEEPVHWDSLAPRVVPGGSAPDRRHHSVVYDARRDRLLTFGGRGSSGITNDVWELGLADTIWRRVGALGTRPGPRVGHTAIYDPHDDRMIVFGGFNDLRAFDEVWELRLADSTWSQLDPAGPPPIGRFYHSAVFDPARHLVLAFGGNVNTGELTGDLQGLALDTLAWSPSHPVLSLSRSDLHLPTITVGDSLTTTFTMSNRGLDRLDVFDIETPSYVIARPASNIRLSWRESVVETLVLVASQPRQGVDTLRVHSNDPAMPRTPVTIGIDVRALEFDSQILGRPTQAPLGAALIVVATPRAGVHVERGTLFYRPAGAATFDSVALVPLATDFIGVIPAEVVTELGVEYFVRVQNGAFAAWRPANAPDSLSRQAVAPAAWMTAAPRPSAPGAAFLVGTPIEVEVSFPQGARFVSGTIHYRQVGAAGSASLPLTVDAPDRPVATIPAADVTIRGIEYWVEVRTIGNSLRFPASAPEIAGIRTTASRVVEPVEHPAGRYRLLSLPLETRSNPVSLSEILAGRFGPYDPVHWRLYRYDPIAGSTVEQANGVAEPYRPGLGFWLITAGTHRVDVGPVETVSTPAVVPYEISLAPGWNQIGNPFAFPVAWSDVARDTAAVDSLIGFDPRLGTHGSYASSAPRVLQPFEGYFVYNESSSATVLRVAPREAVAVDPVRTPAALPAGGTAAWSLGLHASTAQALDEANAWGMEPSARDDFDRLDAREPPEPPGAWVQIGFLVEERAGMQLLRRDVRATHPEGGTWEIAARSSTAGEPITLVVEGTERLPSGWALRMLDREHGHVLERLGAGAGSAGTAESDAVTGRTTSFRILSRGERPYRLALVAGTDAYVLQATTSGLATPSRLVLDAPNPNPFSLSAHIRFGLPRAGPVRIEVFSVMGQRVATLLDRPSVGAGYHSVLWNGRDASGQLAPSGVYVVRAVTGEETRSRRLILLR